MKEEKKPKTKAQSIRYNEVETGISNLISNSGFPAFVLEPMIFKIYTQLVELKAQELKQDKLKESEGKNGIN